MASDSIEEQRILNLYYELRDEFKRLGFSEEDLVSPPTYSNKMWHLRSLIQTNSSALLKKINDYGFDISEQELMNYMEPKLHKINQLTPLENGNKERDNFGDEDN